MTQAERNSLVAFCCLAGVGLVFFGTFLLLGIGGTCIVAGALLIAVGVANAPPV